MTTAPPKTFTAAEYAKKAEWLGKCAALERGIEAVKLLALADRYRRQSRALSWRAVV